jgi:hypothetical protein
MRRHILKQHNMPTCIDVLVTGWHTNFICRVAVFHQITVFHAITHVSSFNFFKKITFLKVTHLKELLPHKT